MPQAAPPPAKEPERDLERLAHTAYVSIRDRIVALQIAPGALLSETLLGADLGLSRTPVREALRRLEREYLVTVLPRRGIVVTEVQLQGQLQLIEFRRGIEARLITRGTARATADGRQRIGALGRQMAASADRGDLAAYIAQDTEFDALIEQAAENPFMVEAMRPVHALVRRYWNTQRGKDGLRQAMLLHASVVAASGRGALDEVARALERLYDFNEDHILGELGLLDRARPRATSNQTGSSDD